MERVDAPIGTVTPVILKDSNTRIRVVDWATVLTEIDNLPAGTWGLIGELDQSVRTHIRRGQYSIIDPALYEVTTRRIKDKPRSRANLYMRRRVS